MKNKLKELEKLRKPVEVKVSIYRGMTWFEWIKNIFHKRGK